MKSKTVYSILASVVLAGGQCVARCGEAQPPATASRMAREDAVLVTVTASVEAIDLAKRESR
jgi:hypothetical protein